MSKVVITGMGVVSPLGCTLNSFWDSLIEGKSGIRRIQSFDASEYPVQIAAEITDFEVEKYMPAKDAKKMDPFSRYGFAAAIDAWEDSGLVTEDIDSERAGVVMGCGTGGLHVAQKAGMALPEKGPKAFSPFMVSQLILNIVSGHIAIKYGLNGPNYVVTTACAGGNHALADAMDLIKRGEADIMLAGGCEGSINEMGIGSFSAMRALCRDFQDEPHRASRPFDADRSGFVMGEGAGVLVLESEEHAQKRGARIYAELAGAGRTCDAHHIVAPDPDARQAARCMRLAMEKGGVIPSQVDYINAHGTSTVLNDSGETRAIHRAFGQDAPSVSISSTKSMTGHLLAGAAAIEAVISVLALNRSVVPPTINFETPDPACDLDITPNVARERKSKLLLVMPLDLEVTIVASCLKKTKGNGMIYPLFKSIAFQMDPEKVHERTLKLLQKTCSPGKPHFMVGTVPDKPVELMGLRFANPVGLAAGMDKDGTCIDGFASLGFGFLELGTVTPLPQPGNPKPRLFRLPEHEAIINRMGFNNGGVHALLENLSQAQYRGIVGINIGKNFDTPIERAQADYVLALRAVYQRADYVTVNISSPNTSNLRELQKGDAFTALLKSIADTRTNLKKETGTYTPIAVKIAPDLDEAQLDFIVGALMESGMDAVIATNTTLDRSLVAGHPRAEEAGGLSGAPVRKRSTEIIRGLADRLDGKVPIIGVGGIFSAADAKEKLDAGASLVQVYSGLIYRGPGLVSEIVRGL